MKLFKTRYKIEEFVSLYGDTRYRVHYKNMGTLYQWESSEGFFSSIEEAKDWINDIPEPRKIVYEQ